MLEMDKHEKMKLDYEQTASSFPAFAEIRFKFLAMHQLLQGLDLLNNQKDAPVGTKITRNIGLKMYKG